MKRCLIACCLMMLVLVARADEVDLTTLPHDLGLPVLVRAGVSFVELKSINENADTFTATVDVRLRWQDLRLAYPALQTAAGYQEFSGEDADKQLKLIWQPHVDFKNLSSPPSFQQSGLRIYPDGRVELMQRTTASFIGSFELQNFPFDRQKLAVELVSRIEPVQKVLLDFRQNELEFSNTQHGAESDGWTLGVVELSRSSVKAWRGEHNPQLKASLVVKRDQQSLIATIFVPLFASLLIPLLVIWLNHIKEGSFTVDAFELTNISIGGLFAVVGLNFTINSNFQKLATGDNPVMRLFALNYFLLGLSIAVGILLYRFNVVRRMFGAHVQEEFFLVLNWAIPLLVFGTAIAMVAMAIY